LSSRRFLALSVVGAALLLAGCGGDGEAVTGRSGADTTNGKQLFAQECASCHSLDDAGSVSQVGPDLDQAFGYACRQGFDEETIFDVVRGQIDLAAPPMPADLVEGQDAVDVAAYVAGVAGTGIRGCRQGTTTGAQPTTGGGQTDTGAQTTTGSS